MHRVGHLLQVRVLYRDGIGGARVSSPPVIGPGYILRRVEDLRPAAEAAVHQNFRQFSSIGQGGSIGGIHRLQGLTGRQMGIIQIRPGGGVPLFRRDLRQRFDSLPVLEGDHGHGDPAGHKSQFQL